ncbi:MAG: hypothetical protein ACRD2N_11050 [Vicinamibacterales bacterium]
MSKSSCLRRRRTSRELLCMFLCSFAAVQLARAQTRPIIDTDTHLANPTSGDAKPEGPAPDTIVLKRLRSTETVVLATIQDGYRRSPTFAELVNNIERWDLFVYVERVRTLANGMRGCLLHGGSGSRYLRVLLIKGMSRDQQTSVLAHELQHVREFLEAGIVNNQAALEALFERIGDRRLGADHKKQYETASALQVGLRVAQELRGHSGRERHRSPQKVIRRIGRNSSAPRGAQEAGAIIGESADATQ